MCCSPGRGGGIHAHVHPHSFGSGHGQRCCCHGGGFRRQVLTKQERLARLEAYLKDLQEEVKAVEERIREIKG